MYDEKSINELVCSKCGNELSTKSKFCSKCGEKNEFYNEEASINREKKHIKLPKVVVVVAVIVIIGLFSFNALGKTFFPDKYAKKAILNSYEAIIKDSKSYNGIPGIIPLLTSNGASEKEVFLEVNDVNNDYISSILSGYGAKLILQSDVENNLMHLNMGILEDSYDLLNVDFFASNEEFVANIPLLYDNPVGVDTSADLSTIGRDSYYDNIRIVSVTQSKIFKESIESKKIVEDTMKNFVKDVVVLTKFEKSNNTNNTFTATIDGHELFEAFKNNAVILMENENIIDFLVYTAYMEDYNYSSFEESKEYVMQNIESTKEMLNEIETDDFEIEDLVVTIALSDDNLVKSLSAETTLHNAYDEKLMVELSGDFDYKKEWVDTELEVYLSDGGDDGANLSYEVSNSSNGNSKYRDTSFNATESQVDVMSISLHEEYDTSSKEYQNSIKLAPRYEEEGFDMEINAEYNGKDTLNFEDVRFGFYDYDYYEVNLGGYLKTKDIKSVDKAKFNNVEYINEMSDNELEDMEESISSKMEMIFGNFYYGL